MDQEIVASASRSSFRVSAQGESESVDPRDWSASGFTVPEYPGYGAIHRLTDIGFAVVLLAVFLPVIGIALVILGLSGGPILFRQQRLGLNGRLFNVYKFRTMVPNAGEVLQRLLEEDAGRREEWEREAKLKDDPRITPIGQFLRKTSLDELPQLFNILFGDMSLVGPRPIEPREIAKYGRYARHYFAQRPGLTGLWQVSGRNDCSYQRRIALDAYYARNRSISLDVSIIVKTIRVVITGHGAY